MSGKNWDRVRPLFFELAELEREERAARLEVLSQGDPELQAELERLAPERARVTFVLAAPQARPFADAAKGWLTAGEGPCRA